MPNPQPTIALHTQKLMQLVESLNAVMEEEISLLEKHDYRRQTEIIKRKQELTLLYQASLKELGSLPDKAALMENGGREYLASAGKKLDETARRNAKALQLAQCVTGRLLQTMMDEIRTELHRDSGYSKQAVMVAAQKSTSLPVAVNQRV